MNKPVLAQSKAITIFIVFALGYFISTLLRAITATISPELVSEFNLTSGELGTFRWRIFFRICECSNSFRIFVGL
jgi:sugar phosphate permease